MILRPLFRRLARSDRGATLVEFAMILPVMLVLFATIVEGGRLMWTYQAAVEGVREASRYLGRVAPSNACANGGVGAYTAALPAMVRNSIDGESLFPTNRQVTVNSVTAACVSGLTWQGAAAPVVHVTATVTVQFPFAALFALVGSDVGTLTTTITDRTRVFGS